MTRKKLKGAVAWGKAAPSGPMTRARWASVNTEEVLAAITQEQPSNEDDFHSVQSGLTSTASQINLVDAFKKSIKKDANAFPDLTNDHKWETFKQKLHVQARVQGLDDVLDPDFLTEDVATQCLFEEQNKFMASVFETILQTSKSKVLLCKHRKSGNAQELHAELVKVCEDPVTKEMTRKELKDKLEAHTIPANWSKSLESWILSWEHKVQDLEDALGTGLQDSRKKTLFEDAIRNNEKLQPMIQQHRIVQSTVARMTGVAITEIEFVGFHDFIVNQAKEIDNLEFKAKKLKALTARVNQHQQGNGNGGNGKGGKDKKRRDPPAWKSDPDFSDFKSTSCTDEKWKSFTKADRKIHCDKEEKRRDEHKKKKEAERARQQNPRQANSHNQLNNTVSCEVIAEEDDTMQTVIPLDDPGGEVARLLSTSHAKKGESQVKETLLCKGKYGL